MNETNRMIKSKGCLGIDTKGIPLQCITSEPDEWIHLSDKIFDILANDSGSGQLGRHVIDP